MVSVIPDEGLWTISWSGASNPTGRKHTEGRIPWVKSLWNDRDGTPSGSGRFLSWEFLLRIETGRDGKTIPGVV